MKNCLKKALAFMIVFILALSTSSFQVKAESYIDVPGGSREVVLVLDSSGSMRNTPISVMKKSAIKFCESMIDAEGSNKIAIVSYSTNVNKTLDFTSDMDAIKNFINSMFASGGTNIADGLKKAKSLLDDSSVNGKKNIVLLTDGLPENGSTSNSGRYDRVGPSYSCKYGNYLYDYYQKNLKDSYNVYTLGFFHSISGSNLEYAQRLLKDIQNQGYYEVTDPDKLIIKFGDVASDIVDTGDEKDCPIIIVPGVMGSQLYNSSMDLVWPSTGKIINPLYRLSDKMAMNKYLKVKNYNYTSAGRQDPINQSLLTEGSREYGAQETYKQLVDGIIDEFTDESGKCTRNVYFFSYDFRRSNDDTSSDLLSYISDVLQANQGHNKVDIVAHSMGGLVVSDYVSDWGSANIRKVVTCGTPYEGAPKLTNSVLTKEVLDNGVFDSVLWALGGLTKETKASFPALAELSPTERYFSGHNSEFKIYTGKTKTGWFSSKKNYSQLTLKQYQDINDTIFGTTTASEARKFHNDIHCASGYNLLASLDNSYFIVGINQKTISGIKYNDGNTLSKIDVDDVTYEMIGDGTVPYDSATMIQQISSLPSSRYMTVETTHTGTVGKDGEENASTALQYVCDILSDRKNAPTTTQLNKQGYIVVKIACPVEVVVEKNGEILSSNKDDIKAMTSYGVLDIFGENADVKTMCLDIDEYDIKLNATDEGTMDFTVRYYNADNELEKEFDFEDVSLSKGMFMNAITSKDGMELNIDEDGDGKADYQLEPGICEGNGHVTEKTAKKVCYSSDNYEVQYDVCAEYCDNYNTNVTITNTSDKKIHNWKLVYNTVDAVENIWNGNFEESEGCTVITNAGHNQDIAPGESVSFGFIAKKNGMFELPEKFRIVTEKGNIDSLEYKAKFEKTSDWGSGYNGTITITNTSEQMINDWTVSFDFDEEITNLWNGEIAFHDGNSYVVTNAAYNHNIKPGESIVIGFTVSNSKTGNVPENYNVYTVN